MRGEIINEYQRLNPEDQKAFRRWLWANAVVGAVLLTGLIALASNFPGDESEAIAQNVPQSTALCYPAVRATVARYIPTQARSF